MGENRLKIQRQNVFLPLSSITPYEQDENRIRQPTTHLSVYRSDRLFYSILCAEISKTNPTSVVCECVLSRTDFCDRREIYGQHDDFCTKMEKTFNVLFFYFFFYSEASGHGASEKWRTKEKAMSAARREFDAWTNDLLVSGTNRTRRTLFFSTNQSFEHTQFFFFSH